MTAGLDEAMDTARRLLGERPAWVVGGTPRDRLLGRPTDDLDLAVADDPAPLARDLARACRGAAFPLSHEHDAWRVVSRGQRWYIDLMPLQGGDIHRDLAQRDFTLNAIAEPLQGGPRLDPYGGEADLRARRLRMVSPQAFDDDPLRVLRAARLACELELEIEPATLAAATARASGLTSVAAERVFAELRHVIRSRDPVRGLRLVEAVGATAVLLPELDALPGVTQSAYHHLDVHEHTLAVLTEVIELQRDPERVLGSHAAAVGEVLAEPLADELTRGDALRLGAVLHDVAKPQTVERTREGRVTFIGHDERGAELARAILARLRASERLRGHVSALVRHHLRLGFLVHQRPLSRRAVYRYLMATDPVEVDVTLLSVADRLATRGRRADEAIAAHLEIARQLLGEALSWRRGGRPRPLLRGDELAAALDLRPGPELGRLLAALDEAQFTGEVASREEAVTFARRLLPGAGAE